MARRSLERAPVDELGMPKPIIYTPLPPDQNKKWNRHHAFFRENDFASNGTETSRAVRRSRLQHVPTVLHERFHKRYRLGLECPTDFRAYGLVLLSYAGYIPKEGIDLSGDGVEREITSKERQRLRRRDAFGIEDAFTIGEYLVRAALRYGIENAEDEMEAFLYDPSEKAAYELIMASSEMAIEPWEAIYRTAHREHALKRGTTARPLQLVSNLIDSMPNITTTVQANIAELQLTA